MEQFDILRCVFSSNANIKFFSKLVCVAYSISWESRLLLEFKLKEEVNATPLLYTS
ncbi:hypothetical protein DAPPUDRAFT_264823 [Daphnia pulex]|uniref:Uncharacterized protein n=1 Tax=Daphnia pulex TaxID=6669 RepID=E9HSE1_DAPPU|nr:hypothetical protein DAPPUDRAFT_264823 [Daphnia pulex]|eukprot:EFX65342.1 hypothetical protein DAPPUDRAFT_264823 [Daphnia pulex]